MFQFCGNTLLLILSLINERGVDSVEFKHAKCVEDDQRRIECEDVPFDIVDRPRPSEWPPGPYALPMTIFGCPETRVQGWVKVSVTFEWDTPHAVLTTAFNMSSADRVTHYRDVIREHWPGFRSYVFGSFGDLKFKLNFCYKHNTSASETNSWPAGNYSIYRIGGNCPKGFRDHEQNVILTNVSRWYYDSYRPDFETEQRDDSTLLRIYLCAMDQTSTEENTPAESFQFPPATDFMLIKNTDTDCPVLENLTAKEESIYIRRYEKSEIFEPVLFETFCFYTSATITGASRRTSIDSGSAEKLLDTKEEKGFIISSALISEGYHSVEPDFRTVDIQDILQMLDNNKGNRVIIPWKLIDLGRTLPVSAVDLQFLNDIGGHLVDGKSLIICFISDIKWSFLHFDAFYCTHKSIYKASVRTLHLLFKRMLYGRFVALVDDTSHKNVLEHFVKIEVITYLYSNEEENAANCNSDIGMTDGSILDLQISASSFHWKYPPQNARPLSSGWCAASTDTAPFIMVDLLEVIEINGLTIANWEEHVYIKNADKIYQFGTRTLKVSYAVSKEHPKNLTEFHLDAARPVNESQTVLFVKPFKARFVTVWILRGLVESLNCLRLELHGCKLAAIPSLNCKTGGYMFDQLSALPLSVSRPVPLEEVSSFIECKKQCRELGECSSVVFERNASLRCFMYPRDTSDRWNILVNNDMIVETSTKLCWNQSLSVAKSLYKVDVVNKTTLSQVSMIYNETIIASMGYPFSYGGDQTYRWIIMLEDKNYIKLIFTNISFHQYMESGSNCYDSLSISKGLIRERNASRDITSRFNGQIFVIETSESSVVLTFRSCFPDLGLKNHGYGFRTIITKQSIPACFSLTSDMSWEVGRSEICTQETMLLTSMSLLGFPFEGTNEEWKLHFPRYRIQLQILQFQVECKIDGKGSEFYIKDLDSKRSYCNLKMPPSKITLLSDFVTVNFYNSRQPRDKVYSEGFVLKYELTHSSKEFMLYGTKSHSTVLNVALGKPTHGSSNYVVGRAGYSNDATDGITHADMMYGSCFHSAFESNPWFVIDLQGIYLLYWTELDMRMDCCDIRHKNAEISTGLELSGMSVAGFICGRFGAVKAVDMHNRIARYVKLELIYGGNFINLCEMQVFGHLVKEIDASDLSFDKPEPVDGQWSIWGSWSDICFCNGSQPRRRICDSPSPYFSGRTCDGTDTSFRRCSPDIQCEVKNIALWKSASMSSRYLIHDANAGIDGDSSQNLSTCFHTQREYQPWWMVDLHDIYHLHHLVMYDLITNATRTRSIEVTAGLTLCEMKTKYFKCGEPMFHSVKKVDMIGTVARYIKLQMMGIKEYFHLCEVEIFGQKAGQTTNKTCEDKNSVDGNWSAWSPWSTCSEHCGTGNKTRTRTCTDPAPTSGGKLCVGDSTDLLSCKEYRNCPYCTEHFEKCYHFFPMLTNWRYAGEECWHRGMRLVSIRSESELRYIKFLLREDRFKNNQPLPTNPNLGVHINASYFTHIGLRRSYRNEYGIFVDLWEDNSPATFLAWGESQPAPGKNCTRMNFRLYDQSKSWETEDCEAQLAEYFVCEQLINSASVVDTRYLPQKHNWIMIPDQLPVIEYLGKENTTTSGLPCTPWVSDDRQLQPYDLQYSTYVHNNFLDDTMFPDGSIAAAENFCRDPSNDRYLWCYTKEDAIKWEECSVQLPFKNDTFDGYFKYTGTLSKTYSGKTCQSWDTKSPHANYAHLYFFPGESLARVSNYCRDPWHNGYLWCYTMDQAARWEPCVLEDTKDDGSGIVFVKYDGQISHTVTGKPCDFWQKHRTSSTTNSFLQENTCQDPLNQGFLWCYISDGSWEPCDFDETQLNLKSGLESIPDDDYSDVFTCNTGQNISQFRECDAVFDCSDFSDETGCWNTIKSHPLFAEVELSLDLPVGFEKGSYFLCNSSLEWISITAYCDGVIDCLDTSDESYCSKISNEKTTCLPDQFQCAEGDCIHISQLCNFVFDCIDHSDENCDFRPCSDAEFRCNNKQCIPLNKRCDSRRDCTDGSDEDLCDSCVADKAFHCDVVKCISQRLRCNSYNDCEDQTDEKSCDIKDFTSCVQWYEAGHKSSGTYFVGGMEVFCDFDSVHVGKMYTIIENREILLDKTCCAETWMFLLSNLDEGKDDYLVWDIITRPEYMCTQEIKQTCLDVHATAAVFDDPAFSNSFQHCDCAILEAHINRNNVLEKPCSVHQNMSEYNIELPSSRNSKLTFRYSEVMIYRQMEYLGTPNKFVQYFPGPIICEHEYIRKDEVVTCETDLKCVYDVDEMGIILGCRNGSHLENCEGFVCPQNTVKCPGSYCIPIRFVCDGAVQCPGGQDENNCGCEEELEILILYHADGFRDATFIEKFANQFYTSEANIRLLSYTASQPLQEEFNIEHAVMHITETQMSPFTAVNRLPDYQYKLTTKHFLRDILFLRNGTTKRGMIFLENSETAGTIAGQMFIDINETLPTGVKLFRITEDPIVFPNNLSDKYEHVQDVKLKRWRVLSSQGLFFFPELCAVPSKVLCGNAYKCSWSRNCIPLHQVCDGFIQCPHGDDERLCHFQCPRPCSCRGYAVFCSNKNIRLDDIKSISKNTRQLDLSINKDLINVFERSHFKLVSLVRLNLSMCSIEVISHDAFRGLRNLISLDLSYNSIGILSADVFIELRYLKTLKLKGNYKLSIVQSGAFNGLGMIRDLDLANAQLKTVEKNTFSRLNLNTLDLSNNSIKEIKALAFSDLTVNILNFKDNEILNFNKEIFTGVASLEQSCVQILLHKTELS